MIPTIQMIPTSFLPFLNHFNISPVQYLNPWETLGYTYYKSPDIWNWPVNSYPEASLTLSLSVCPQEKLTDTSSLKIENSQTQLKNKIHISTHKKEFKSEQVKIKPAKQSSSTLKGKKIQSKNKIIKISQNKNRNIIPSVVQQIFSYLSKPNKSKVIVNRVFSLVEKPLDVEISTEKYFYFIKQIKDRLNHYLNTNSLSVLCNIQPQCLELISQAEQIYYLNIARRVARHFLDNQLPLLIIHSKRMFEDKRVEHLRVRRLLAEALQGLIL